MGESEGLDGNFNLYLEDCGLDGICEYLTMPFDANGDGDFDDVVNGIVEFDGTKNENWPGFDADGTERDGVMQTGDTFISNSSAVC